MSANANLTPSLLIIDDEIGPRESLRFLFNTCYDVHTADGVDAGVAQIRQRTFDAVVMDIKMPGKSGIEGLREIREQDPLVSILMLTGFGSLDTAQQAIRLGANDYLQKPFDVSEMRTAVAAAIERTAVMRARADAESKVRELNAELQASLQRQTQLAALGQASEAFVHDLRSPLTVIGGYAQILSQTLEEMAPFSPDKARDMLEYLQLIEQGAERCHEMAAMWQDLGRLNPKRSTPLALASLCAEVIETARPRAAANDVELSCRNGPACTVRGDATQLVRALQNVLNNAIDAAPSGSGRVTLSWTASGDSAVMRVEDNGPGIAEDILSTIFEPDFSTKQKSGGMGLGLFIVRQIVQAHGGRVEIGNRREGGAIACLTLPLNPNPPEP